MTNAIDLTRTLQTLWAGLCVLVTAACGANLASAEQSTDDDITDSFAPANGKDGGVESSRKRALAYDKKRKAQIPLAPVSYERVKPDGRPLVQIVSNRQISTLYSRIDGRHQIFFKGFGEGSEDEESVLLPKSWLGHQPSAVRVSDNLRYVAVGDSRGVVQVYDRHKMESVYVGNWATSQAPELVLESPAIVDSDGRARTVQILRFSGNGRRLASLNESGLLSMFDLETKALLDTVPHPFCPNGSLQFSPDGEYLLLDCSAIAYLIPFDRGREYRILGEPRYSLFGDPTARGRLDQNERDVGLRFSADSKKLVALNRADVRIWNVDAIAWDVLTGTTVLPPSHIIALERSSDFSDFGAVTFLPDGQTVLVARGNKVMRLSATPSADYQQSIDAYCDIFPDREWPRWLDPGPKRLRFNARGDKLLVLAETYPATVCVYDLRRSGTLMALGRGEHSSSSGLLFSDALRHAYFDSADRVFLTSPDGTIVWAPAPRPPKR